MTEKFCAGCRRHEERNKAKAWCVECGEMVCKPCSKVHKRLSPPHEVLLLDNINESVGHFYLQAISQTCLKHKKKKMTLFCCQHDDLVCDSCITESHYNCKPILTLEAAAEDIKQSTALSDLERRLDGLSKLTHMVNSGPRADWCQRKDKVKDDIVKNIADLKNDIIDHLDTIECSLLKEIDQLLGKHENNSSTATNSIGKKTMNDSVERWKKSLSYLKGTATKIHLFQIVKFLDKQVHVYELNIQRQNEAASIPILKFNPSDMAINFKSVITSLGSVTVASSPELSSFDKDHQGQFFVKPRESKLLLASSFETRIFGNDIETYEGCLITDGNVLLVPDKGNFLIHCQGDGSESRKIELPYRPSCVALYDNDRALVSSGEDFIQVIDLSNHTTGIKVKVGRQCKRIVCRNDKIWLNSAFNVLTQIDINGKVEKTINMTFDPNGLCVHPTGSLYCTNCRLLDQDVYKLSIDGEVNKIYSHPELWNPVGVTTDDRGDVFIAGYGHGNVHKLSQDGEHSSIVLTKEDGIRGPTRLDYNTQTKQLMMIHNHGTSVNIYNVK